MKKLILEFHNFIIKIKNKSLLLLWLIIHLGIIATLGISLFFAPPLKLSTQIFDLFPQTDISIIAEVDSILAERNGRQAIILFASPVFEKAKNAGLSFYNEFKNESEIESAVFLFDSGTISEIADFFFKYRFVIADANTVEILESGNTEEIAMDALVMAYGAINYIPLDNLDKDPFLLTERGVRNFLSSSLPATGNMGIKDDVLAVQKDGTWFVMLQMTLAPQAVSVINIKNNIVAKFYAFTALIKETEQDSEIPINFYYSGAPFHGYESASNAQKEASIIGVISILFVLFILLFVFRSHIPVVFSIIDILISLLLGTAATFLIFREIHVFTFIFGTVIIGICIDYSIHFFTQWMANAALKNGQEIRSYISKSMIMCFFSSIICYSAVIFAPLPIFKQFSVFTITGLFSSFLTAYCIYPLLKLPDENKRRLILINLKFLQKIKFSIHPVLRIVSVLILAAASIIILCINPHGLKFNNDFNNLYKMPPHLEESEILTAMVMDQTSAPLYFIISGSSAEETLKNEERLVLRLQKEIKNGNLRSIMGTSITTPSLETQEKTYLAMSSLLPLAGRQYERLGFPPEYEKLFYDEYAVGNNYLRPENASAWTGFSNLWIGEVNGNYYSCLFLFHAKDKRIFTSIADEFDSVHLINIDEIINRDLNKLTKIIVLFFFAAFIIVAVIVFNVYQLKESLKICIVPVLVALAVMAVLAVLNLPLGFLSITAIILVFGLGIDFIIYMTGSKKGYNKKLTRLAVFLSFLTTSFSFGLLAFCSFMPIYIFGVTVAVGLSAAFIFTMLLQGKAD